METKNIKRLFSADLKVINLGLSSFAENLKDLKVKVVKMEWRPPAGGNARMIELLRKLGR